jgi:hypothetical protein
MAEQPFPESESLEPPDAPAGYPDRPVITEKDLSRSSNRNAVFELAFQQRHMVYQAIQEGAFPLLPDKDGHIDTRKPVNLVSGYEYRGSTILTLKAHQGLHKFPTPEYVSDSQLEEANRRAGLHYPLRPHAHPVTLSVTDTKTLDADGFPSVKFIRLYNIAEVTHPGAVRRLAQEHAAEQEQKYHEWQEKKALEAAEKGETFEKRPFRQHIPYQSSYAFKIDQRDPVKYFGQVFTAMHLGTANVSVNHYSAADMKENLVQYLYEKDISKKTGNAYSNPLRLYTLGTNAGILSKENLDKMFGVTIPDPENPHTQNRSRKPLPETAAGDSRYRLLKGNTNPLVWGAPYV